MKRSLGLSLLIIFASPVLGHHSDVGLDMESVVALKGTVTEFRWSNPHVYITLNSADENGDDVEWKLQTGAISLMSRMGWTSDSVAVDEIVDIQQIPCLFTLTPHDDGAVLCGHDLRHCRAEHMRAF